VGIVENLRLDPGRAIMEATVTDGTGALTARWPLDDSRPNLYGIRAVALQGMAVVGEDGELLMEDTMLDVIPPPDFLNVG
jgi:hypothetical protein